MEHVITASQDTEPKARSSTGTWSGPQDTHYIAGAIAYQGLCLLGEVGIHQLTFGTLSECQGSARFWFDQLDGYRPLRVEVQSLAVFAFRAHNAQNISHAEI